MLQTIFILYSGKIAHIEHNKRITSTSAAHHLCERERAKLYTKIVNQMVLKWYAKKNTLTEEMNITI